MKQTAVEWFFKALIENQDKTYKQIELILAQAKEMEKEQIIEAYYQIGKDHQDMIFAIEKNAEQYYTETYESNT